MALLFELSRKIPNLIVRVEDSDGEFLLIEAADHLPGWATPEKCTKKVYIMNGHLHLIQRQEDLSMAQAVALLRQSPLAHRVGDAMESSVRQRIQGYLDGTATETQQHRSNAFVPLNVARLLQKNPNWVAASVQAFCNRDPIDLKAIRAMKFFAPENRVYTSVRFSKCLYAMLLHQQYNPDRRTGWQLPPKTHENHKEAVLGMRLACGFEILVANAQKKGQLEFDETDKHWCVYHKSLLEKGYFKGLLEGSREYEQLKETAKDYFLQNECNDTRWTSEVGADILKQLRSINEEDHEANFPVDKAALPPSDDDAWMNVDAAELDRMMKERYKANLEDLDLNGEEGDDGDEERNGANLAKQLEQFLKMKSDYEGVEGEKETTTGSQEKVPKMDTGKESAAIDFDPDMFATHVKNLLDFVIPEDDNNWHSEDSGDMSDYDDDGDGEGGRNNLEKDMKEGKMKKYMQMMDKELKATTLGKSFVEGEEKKKKQNEEAENNGEGKNDTEFDDIEAFKPVDIEMNTLKNMLESYQSQLGGPGPTSNLLNSMGFNIKRAMEKVQEGELKEETV